VLDAQWSGPQALGYHLGNVALHVIAAILFFALLRCFALGRTLTLAAALVFAVHPLFVPTVAWIPGRNDSLLAVFALSAWLLFARDLERPSGHARVLHLAFFALALFTKETAVMLPPVCILHAVLVRPRAWARLRQPRVLGTLVAGWGGILALDLWARALVIAHPIQAISASAMRAAATNLPLLLVAFGKVILPTRLSAIAVAQDLPLWPGILAAGIVVAALRVAPARPRVVGFGVAAFGLWLAPTLAVPGSLVMDSRFYLPACGAIIAMAEVVRSLWLERGLLIGLSFAAISALALITLGYEGAFRDSRSFARDAVLASPHSALAHFCLAQTYHIAGANERALDEYRTALSLGPAQVVHNNIAVLYMADGHWNEAETELRAELATNDSYGPAHHNLGIVLRRQGHLEEATAEQEAALLRQPDDASAIRELALDWAARGDPARAASYAQRVR
jgi:tetratricopeptide (TPR) repeat protein